jgi:hypothetical protein
MRVIETCHPVKPYCKETNPYNYAEIYCCFLRVSALRYLDYLFRTEFPMKRELSKP